MLPVFSVNIHSTWLIHFTTNSSCKTAKDALSWKLSIQLQIHTQLRAGMILTELYLSVKHHFTCIWRSWNLYRTSYTAFDWNIIIDLYQSDRRILSLRHHQSHEHTNTRNACTRHARTPISMFFRFLLWNTQTFLWLLDMCILAMIGDRLASFKVIHGSMYDVEPD